MADKLKELFGQPKIPAYEKEINDIFEQHQKSAFTDEDWPRRSLLGYVKTLIETVKRHEEIRMEKYVANLNATEMRALRERCRFKTGKRTVTRS